MPEQSAPNRSTDAIWQQPPWECPGCEYTNLPIRSKCRNCGYVRRDLSLTFGELALANLTRCEEAFHPLDDWSPADWAMAAAGELGEAFNLIKKSRRKEYTELHAERQAIAHELADAVIYIDLLCARLGISLGEAVAQKFNIVSDRVGSAVKLAS